MAFKVAAFIGNKWVLIAIAGVIYWCVDKNTAKTAAYSAFTGMVICAALSVAFTQYDLGFFVSPNSAVAAGLGFFTSLCLKNEKRPVIVMSALAMALIIISQFGLSESFIDIASGAAIAFVTTAISYGIHKGKGKYTLFYYTATCIVLLNFVFWCDLDMLSVSYMANMGLIVGLLGGTSFEENHVHFTYNGSKGKMALRIIIGGALTAGIALLFVTYFSQSILFTFFGQVCVMFAVFGAAPALFRVFKL